VMRKWISGFLNLGIGGLWRGRLRNLGIEEFWDLGIKGFGRVNHRVGNPSIIPLFQYSNIPWPRPGMQGPSSIASTSEVSQR